MQRPKILIYGGSFNPPTIAHAAVIDTVLQIKLYNQLWLMPSKSRSDKLINVPADLRLNMIKALVKECFGSAKKIRVSDFELSLPGKTMTKKTSKLLQENFPLYDFTWLVGADSWLSIDTWEGGKELLGKTNWLIIPREGYEIIEELPKNASLLKKPVFASPVSSTMLRKRISENLSAMPFVTPAVSKIIEKHNLYRVNL
jgi:nicotinate-nucleotide adenylyltransferase